MKNVILAASFAFFVAASGTAHAQTASLHARQVEVSYADLNLNSEAGAHVMLSRLQAAARQACGGWPDMHNLDTWTIYRNCVRDAMDGAMAQLNAPLVAQLYGGAPERLAYSY